MKKNSFLYLSSIGWSVYKPCCHDVIHCFVANNNKKIKETDVSTQSIPPTLNNKRLKGPTFRDYNGLIGLNLFVQGLRVALIGLKDNSIVMLIGLKGINVVCSGIKLQRNFFN